jgi:hypothetical protein
LVRCTCGSEKRFTESGLQKLKVKQGETVLEIGFGTGHALVALARLVGQSGKVYGEAGFRLAERWAKWEAEVGDYRHRAPIVDNITFTDENNDIYEYYHPETGDPPPNAASVFGWSSAVFIDLAIKASRGEII